MQRISKKRRAVLSVPLVIGIWLGYLTSGGFATGGLDAAFALAGVALAAVILVVFGFFALLLYSQPNRAGRPAARANGVAALLLIVGLGMGSIASIGVHALWPAPSPSVEPDSSPNSSPASTPHASFSASALASPTPGPTWTTTGDMLEPRNEHTATFLLDGRVLVVGGIGADSSAMRSAELYEPASGRWTAAGNMRVTRWSHTATTLPDGTVLVAGGEHPAPGTPETGSVERYDPATGTWTDLGNMTQPRWGHTATLLPDGRVLVAGAGTSEFFDPETGSRAATGEMVANREGHTATLLLDGSVLVAGGCCGTTSPEGSSELASAELFDPRTGSWTAVGNLVGARTQHTATLLPNGIVLVAGGYLGSGDAVSALASAELYDPSARTWKAAGDMTGERWPATATLLPNGTVLVTGDSGRASSAELYRSGVWTSTVAMLQSRSSHTATLLLDGSVLVAGGSDNSTGSLLTSAELYR